MTRLLPFHPLAALPFIQILSLTLQREPWHKGAILAITPCLSSPVVTTQLLLYLYCLKGGLVQALVSGVFYTGRFC